jgi:hypothetical protein
MTDHQNESKISTLSYAGNVTAHSFIDQAKAYVAANELWWKTINPIDNPQQWGAWFSYRKEKKLDVAFMRCRAKEILAMKNHEQRAKCGFAVPCMFPSDFDEDRQWADDQMAGDWFMDKLHNEKVKQAEADAAWAAKTAEEKQAFISRATKGMVRDVDCS